MIARFYLLLRRLDLMLCFVRGHSWFLRPVPGLAYYRICDRCGLCEVV